MHVLKRLIRSNKGRDPQVDSHADAIDGPLVAPAQTGGLAAAGPSTATGPDYPGSVDEARDHIMSIRRERGFSDDKAVDVKPGSNIQDLERALELLSEDLYQQMSHFLLELIQNADDNEYTVATPTLSLDYTPGRLQIDCNERGFSKRNVEAICRIGLSTKAGAAKNRGYVGEKGIGFKAVFKVADEVFISSGYYSFKFEKKRVLGMINPVWSEFPGKTDGSCTSILLLLNKGAEGTVEKALRGLDARLMMFLRRLRKVDVSIRPSGYGLKRSTSLTRRDPSPNITVLGEGTVETQYFICRHLARNLPAEEKRPGITQSEIVLAFPFQMKDEKMVPVIDIQDLFAFLPIRRGGLPFMLHADFILTSSREDIADINGNAWNKALAEAGVAAAEEAMFHFADRVPDLRYTWPRYLPAKHLTTGLGGSFFSAAFICRLTTRPILESRTGTKVIPKGAIIVPRHYVDSHGVPLTLHTKNQSSYISDKYDQEDLRQLSVRTMGPQDFIDDLKAILDGTAKRLSFPNDEDAWHTHLAKVIPKLDLDSDLRRSLNNLPLIPLRGGGWATALKGPIYFPAGPDHSLENLPEGVSVRFVEESSARNVVRRSFFTSLHVKQFDREVIVKAINDVHFRWRMQPPKLNQQALVSHAKFLYESSSTSPDRDLWMATEDGRTMRASSLYFPSGVECSARQTLSWDYGKSSFSFIHADYLHALRGGERGSSSGTQWIQDELGVRVFPRLVKESVSVGGLSMTLHDDFIGLMKNKQSAKWLSVMKAGWKSTYGPILTNEKNKACLKVFGAQDVKCRGGRTYPLQSTYLAIDALDSELEDLVPFLDVPNPKDPAWRPLHILGFGLEKNLKFYMDALKGMSGKPAEKVKKDDVAYIYEQIQARTTTHDRSSVRDYLHEREMVFIPKHPKSGKPSWVRPVACNWGGPPWLQQSHCLKHVYPQNAKLFEGILLLEDANVYTAHTEAMYIKKTDSLDEIYRILLFLQSFHEVGTFFAIDVASLQRTAMFPTTNCEYVKGNSYNEVFPVADLGGTKRWFIADKEWLRDAFAGKVNLLAFGVEKMQNLRPLLKVLGLESRFLSQISKCFPVAKGKGAQDEDLTLRYRSRAEFIIRLVPYSPKRSAILGLLHHLEVSPVSTLSMQWELNANGKPIRSRPYDVPAAAYINGSKLIILMRRDYADEGFPTELSESLGGLLGVPEGYIEYLTMVLSPYATTTRIQDVLDKAGIRGEVAVRGMNAEDGAQGEEGGAAFEFDEAVIKDEEVLEAEAEAEETAEDSTEMLKMEPSAWNPPSARKTGPFWDWFLAKPRVKNAGIFAPTTEGQRLPEQPFTNGVTRTKSASVSSRSEVREAKSSNLPSAFSSVATKIKLAGAGIVFLGLSCVKDGIIDQLIGEKLISEQIASILGDDYEETTAWNRSKDMVSVLSSRDASQATFVFADVGGRFANFLAAAGHEDAAQWVNTCVEYHVDVKSTSKDISKPFSIDELELQRYRRISTEAQAIQPGAPSRIAILVRIGHVRDEFNRETVFCLDPWMAYFKGDMTLSSLKGCQARLTAAKLNGPPQAPRDADGSGEGFVADARTTTHSNATKKDASDSQGMMK